MGCEKDVTSCYKKGYALSGEDEETRSVTVAEAEEVRSMTVAVLLGTRHGTRARRL